MNTSKVERLLRQVYQSRLPDACDLEFLLSLNGDGEAAQLFEFADRVRERYCSDGILLRGIVEFSNICGNNCSYCGLSARNSGLRRYRMTGEEIIESARRIAANGIKTAVLQSGEDDGLDAEWLAGVIRRIKRETGIAITLSVGEKTRQEYARWKEAGADRYLLKIETTDRALYESLHPGMSFENRLRCLLDLRGLGYQVGSGIIVGLKGQTLRSIAEDIIFFAREDFDMVGIGPFIAHPCTPLAGEANASAGLVLKTVALTRIVTRNAHLPATTALGSLERDFRVDALRAGANVLMPNFTPQPYRWLYEIYPGKRCMSEPVGACVACMEALARLVSRSIDYSRGDTLKMRKEHANV